MTISSSTSRNEYTASASQTEFTYTFKIFDDDDVTVIQEGTTLTKTTDYTVSGVGNANGGTITLVTGATSGDIIVITRNEPLTQEVDFVEGDDLPSTSLEEGLDRSAIRDQDLQEQIDRSFKFTEGSSISGISNELSIDDMKGFALGFNSSTGAPEPVSVGDGSSTSVIATGTTASRNLANRFSDFYNVLDFGASGDGVTDDTTEIQAAITAANTDGKTLYWPEREYIVSSNLTSFWDIEHEGYGRITRGSDTYYITPVGTQTNIMYVADAGVTANDGLTAAIPTKMTNVAARLKLIGNKAQGGIWRIQMAAETTTLQGMRLNDFPAFRNPLEIFGAGLSGGIPTSIWDGTGNVEGYALLSQQTSAQHNLHIQNIKFTNWTSGALAIFGNINIYTEECHCDGGANGFWYRDGYVKHEGGIIENVTGDGVKVQYNCSFNIDDVEFDNCDIGVLVGRTSAGWVGNSTFTNITSHCISATMQCRIRTISNTFTDWGISAIRADASQWDNGSTERDTFSDLGTDSPALLAVNGGVQTFAGESNASGMNEFNNQNAVSLASTTTRTNYQGLTNGAHPFKIPEWALYSNSAKLKLEALITVGSSTGGTKFEITGAGSAAGLMIAEIDIPSGTGTVEGKLTMEVLGPREGSTSAEYYCTFVGRDTSGGAAVTAFNRGVEGVNDSLIRNTSSDELSLRLYLTNTNSSGSTSVRNLRTYYEV